MSAEVRFVEWSDWVRRKNEQAAHSGSFPLHEDRIPPAASARASAVREANASPTVRDPPGPREPLRPPRPIPLGDGSPT